MRIGWIGLGNMGKAFVRGMRECFSREQLFLYDCEAERMRGEVERYGTPVSSITELLDHSEWVALAVKPNQWRAIVREEPERWQEKKLFSLMAGISIASLRRESGSPVILRCMPNLAVQVHLGMIGWFTEDALSERERKMWEEIFSALGVALFLKEERQLEKMTPLTSSAPALYFLLTELLEKVGIERGFSPQESRTMAEMTFWGAAHFLHQGGDCAQVSRCKVSSPGGVTETMIHFLGSERERLQRFDSLIRAGDERIGEMREASDE